MTVRTARRGSLFTPSSASFVAPTFVAAETDWGLSGDSPIIVGPPAGVAADDYQLVGVMLVSSSPTFGTTPSGWAKLLDISVVFSDGASSGRVGLFESTTSTTQFSIPQVGSARAWRTARAGWRGHGGRPFAPASATTGVTSSPATPPVTTGDPNSLVIGLGFAEEPNGGSGWGFTDTGSFTTRVNATAVNAIESGTLVIADQLVATPTAGVSTNFTIATATETVMASVVLRGAPA